MAGRERDDAAAALSTSTAAPASSSTAAHVPFEQRPVKICVFCGASSGRQPAHMEAARQLATAMAANKMALVYGGGTLGLMGELARTLVSLSGAGAVHGIIPEALARYGGGGRARWAPDEAVFGRTTIVPDMHTRKRMMAQEVMDAGPGSGFIALPGGYGTLEELMEATAWNQLGIQSRGICLLNINGFYDGLLRWVQTSVDEGFILPGNGRILVSAATPVDAIRALAEYKAPESCFKLQWASD